MLLSFNATHVKGDFYFSSTDLEVGSTPASTGVLAVQHRAQRRSRCPAIIEESLEET
jgi:hypothetical protein